MKAVIWIIVIVIILLIIWALVGKRGDDVPADTTADNSPAAVAEAVPAEGASGVVETTVEASAEGSVDVGAPKTE